MFGAESRTPSDQSRAAPEESVHVWYLPLQAVESEYLLPENEQNRLHDYHIEARNAARKEATGKIHRYERRNSHRRHGKSVLR